MNKVRYTDAVRKQLKRAQTFMPKECVTEEGKVEGGKKGSEHNLREEFPESPLGGTLKGTARRTAGLHSWWRVEERDGN